MDLSNLQYDIAERIVVAMCKKRISCMGLAEKMNVSRQTVSQYRNGRKKYTLEGLYQIAYALNISIIDLIPQYKTKEN